MNDGLDYVMYVVFGLLGLLVLFLIAAGIGALVDEIEWWRTPAFKYHATLIRSSHLGSTLETHAVTTVTSGGQVGVGTVMTGHDEEFYTLWDCGKYGHVSIEDEIIFQYAKEKSDLWIKVRGDEVRIVGIEHCPAHDWREKIT